MEAGGGRRDRHRSSSEEGGHSGRGAGRGPRLCPDPPPEHHPPVVPRAGPSGATPGRWRRGCRMPRSRSTSSSRRAASPRFRGWRSWWRRLVGLSGRGAWQAEHAGMLCAGGVRGASVGMLVVRGGAAGRSARRAAASRLSPTGLPHATSLARACPPRRRGRWAGAWRWPAAAAPRRLRATWAAAGWRTSSLTRTWCACCAREGWLLWRWRACGRPAALRGRPAGLPA